MVLIDFWTYSCINCQRTLPHVEAWNRAYGADGLTVIGIHTPEFAFEHVTSNVARAASQLGRFYPIAQDNGYATWNAYKNNYWPAEYLVDATGTIRHVDFGEGQYDQTESFVRQLLVAADPRSTCRRHRRGRPDPERAHHPRVVPRLSARRAQPGRTDRARGQDGRLRGALQRPGRRVRLRWQLVLGPEASTAGTGATLDLAYQAKDVYLVLGGSGTVRVSVNGKPTETVTVSGEPKLYQLVGSAKRTGAAVAGRLARGAGLRLHLRLARFGAVRTGRSVRRSVRASGGHVRRRTCRGRGRRSASAPPESEGGT